MQNETEKLQKILEHLVLIKKEVEEALGVIDLKVSENKSLGKDISDTKEYFEDELKIIEGIFNGEIMIGPDDKQYSIPANYISKSKIVEGDKLKLTIKKDGTFIYKQIEPIERVRLTGVLTKDETQKGYLALADGKLYKVQKAAVTYFRGEYGDSLTILVPKGKNSTWAAIENIVKENEPLSYKEGHFDNKEEEIEEKKEVEKPKEEKIEEIKKVSPKKELSLNDIKPIRLEDLE